MLLNLARAVMPEWKVIDMKESRKVILKSEKLTCV
jgi:hypothetical protein